MNLILISCHDLGRYLNCYGVSTVRTPNLDALAAGGIRCDQAFSTAPGCSPSRASIVTGRYPHSNGVMGLVHERQGWDLNDTETPLGVWLKSFGYRTALAGLQHEARHDNRLGFDERLSPICAHDYDGTDCLQVAEAVDRYLQRTESDTSPFYLQIGLFEPHRAPQEPGGFPPGLSEPGQPVSVPNHVKDSESVRRELFLFQAAIQKADVAIGRIIEAVERCGLSANTLIIFTSDHGIPFPRAKCTLFDTGTGVPLIFYGPSVPSGTVYPSLISLVDLFPTVCELLKIPSPDCVQGVSHAHSFPDGSSPRKYIFSEQTYHDYYDPLRAVRTDTHKLIVSFSGTRAWMDPTQQWIHQSDIAEGLEPAGARHPQIRLYDLKSDPKETVNLANRSECRDICSELCRVLLDWMETTGDPLLDGVPGCPEYKRAFQTFREYIG